MRAKWAIDPPVAFSQTDAPALLRIDASRCVGLRLASGEPLPRPAPEASGRIAFTCVRR
jgi:hypothetical protein